MDKINYFIIFLAALIPLIIGFIWYHKSVFGNAWIAASGVDPNKSKDTNMFKVFGLTYLLSLFLTFAVITIVIHQTHMYSIFANDPSANDAGSESGKYLGDFMNKYGQNFRTFKHGAFHGGMAGFLLSSAILGINALFESKSLRYVLINVGYWVVTISLMGGLISAFL